MREYNWKKIETVNPKVHALKTLPEYFTVVGSIKPFEVRKNDRDFKIGDVLWLQEWSEEEGYTGNSKKFTVSYLLENMKFGLQEGYCIMGLGKYEPKRDFRTRSFSKSIDDAEAEDYYNK